MRSKSYILPLIVLILLGAFWIWEIWQAGVVHWKYFHLWCGNTHRKYYPWLLWLALGVVVYPFINRRWKNSELIKTLTHERTHMLVNLIFFQKVNSLEASSSGNGVVWYQSNGRVPSYLSALAPYCFPFLSIVCILLRCLCNISMLPFMDVLLGISLGLHFTCIKEQTGNHQTDIRSFPLWFSYTYIVHFWLFHTALLLCSLKPGTNIFLAFRDFGVDFWHVLVLTFNMIF